MYLINIQKEFKSLDKESFFINDREVGRWFFNDGIPEKSLMNWCIENFIDSGKNFIDIGAHIGTWSWTIADHAFHTYSFECNPEVYNCLCANIFLKDMNDKITAYNVGLSSEEENQLYRFRSKDGGGNGFGYLGDEREKNTEKVIPMKLKRLDDFDLKNIGFLKIDVEGYEKKVLEGAIKTLENNKWPPFVFESWDPWREENEHLIPASSIREELFNYIDSIGYNITPIMGYKEMFLATKK